MRRRDVDGEVRYALTPAGHELRPVVEAIGTWGVRWIGTLGDVDLDPHLLLWDMHRHVDHDAVPAGRTVVHFAFDDAPARATRWWLVIHEREADICDSDPGHPVTVTVAGSLRALVRVWRGDVPWERALADEDLRLLGPREARRALPGWFRLSAFASVPRPEVTAG